MAQQSAFSGLKLTEQTRVVGPDQRLFTPQPDKPAAAAPPAETAEAPPSQPAPPPRTKPLGKPKRKPVPDVTHLNIFGNRYELTAD